MTMQSACPLCESDGGVLVWRDDRLRVIQANEADYPGFCRIVWHDHVAELSDLGATDRAWLFDVLICVEQVVRAQMQCDKINLASFGNQVPHLHWHVIPRFTDDAHFPQAIWAPVQRQVEPVRLALHAARALGLSAALCTALDGLIAAA